MTDEAEAWWAATAEYYQDEADIPVGIHYGPGSQFEDDLGLLASVDGQDVVELGCGGAQCSVAFAERGADVTAVDLSAEQLSFARELADERGVEIDFHLGDVTALSLADESQDLAFSAFVIQWVADLQAFVEETHRVLRPDGEFVLSGPHPFYSTVDPETLELQRSYFDVGREVTEHENADMVLYQRTLGDIHTALVEAGFTVEAVLEPDPDEVDAERDPWHGIWEYRPELLERLPPTIIFRARK